MSKYSDGLSGAFFLFLLQTSLATPLWNPQGMGRNIRHLPCVSRKTGEAGTCMFAFSCAKANGTHLGTCIDRFYFGSCCKIPDNDLDVAPPVEDNHIGEGEGTTTPRIRPAITQKPYSTTKTPTRPSTLKPTTQYTTGRPSTTGKPSSTYPPAVSSSRPQLSSSRPIVSGGKPADLTTPVPTFVTWTTLEEGSSQKPIKPLVSTPSVATHKPTVITQGTFSPPKKTSTTTRPSSTHKPITNKPSIITKPTIKPAPSTPRPSQPTKPSVVPTKPTTLKPTKATSPTTRPTTPTKPTTPSTTWIPVSVTTHAPSTQNTKKPSTTIPSKKPTTSQTVVNVLEVSNTSKPLVTTPTGKPTSQKPISTTSKPITTQGSTRPPISSTQSSHSTHKPSTQRPTVSTTSASSTKEPPVVVISSSTALPSIQTSPQLSSTSSLSSTTEVTNATTTPLPETNEVESFNKTNYKEVCGRRLFPEARIVGGQVSGFGKWPWQISLRQWRTSTFLHKCGAALLNENWAITAAHCVENVPPSDLLLRLGEHDLSTEEEPYGYEERRVQIVASHPQFDPRTFEYDLALLRFYEPVTFQPNIIPVCVPEDDTNFVGSTAFVTGWGRLYEDGPLPSILQEVSVPVINNTLCETMYRAAGYIEHIPDIFICAGWKKGGFDSCEGDSGGPMVIQRADRRWLLAGVISWGIGCAEPNQPGVYTRISQFRHWINQILQF